MAKFSLLNFMYMNSISHQTKLLCVSSAFLFCLQESFVSCFSLLFVLVKLRPKTL